MEHEGAYSNDVLNKVITYINMFGARVIVVVRGELQSGLIVAMQGGRVRR